MKKTIYIALLVLTFFGLTKIHTINKKPKILHLGFHKGCLKDFEEVCRTFGLQVWSWLLPSSSIKVFDGEKAFFIILDKNHKQIPLHTYSTKNPTFFDGETTNFNVYNISHKRAQKVWNCHKDYFNQFDLIVTSDTAPLSRIFLQNNWKKPLIVWVCNRFDYHHEVDMDCEFPDPEYYYLINKAATMDNVKIISYTDYEHLYARNKGVYLGEKVIKPIGLQEKRIGPEFKSKIPKQINKKETIFISPRLYGGKNYAYIKANLEKQGISHFCGKYNGPEDLKEFKGVLFFPYQASNISLFENFQRGIVQFVPSETFLKEKRATNELQIPFVWYSQEIVCEWYNKENRDYLIYFNSWEDLQYKIKNTDYEYMRKKIRAFGKKHRETMLQRWKKVFNEIIEGM